MQLLTEKIKKKLPKLYSTENVPTQEKRAIVKYFTPDSNWTWYVCEGEQQTDGDWLFFGYVEGIESEWGYFTLSQLKEVRGLLNLPVERDLYFSGKIPSIKFKF